MSKAKIILVGGGDAGLEFLPTAFTFLKMVRDTGIASVNKSFPTRDGWIIRVVLDPYTGDKVYIESPKCPRVRFSGLLDTFSSMRESGSPTPKYLIDEQLEKEYRLPRSDDAPILPAKLFCGVRPVNNSDLFLSAIEGTTSPSQYVGADGDVYIDNSSGALYQKELGSWYLIPQDSEVEPLLTDTLPVESTVLPEPGSDSLVGISPSVFKQTYARLRPSKFAGIMRRVMQATLATPMWDGFNPTPGHGAKLPVDYKFGNSWGCLKSGKKYYFVRITQTAIYYVPASYCVYVDKSSGVDTEVIVLKTLNEDKKVKIGEILIADAIGSSWDAEIGWAFSYDKLEASVVYAGSVTAVNSSGREEGYIATSLATITFTVSGDALTSAEFSLTRQEILFHPFYRMDVPTGRALFNIVTQRGVDLYGEPAYINSTVDFGTGWNKLPPANYGAEGVPVFVYYAPPDVFGSDTRQVWGYHYEYLPESIQSAPYPDSYTEQLLTGKYGTYTTAACVRYGFSTDRNPSKASPLVNFTGNSYAEYGHATDIYPASSYLATLIGTALKWSCNSSTPPADTVYNVDFYVRYTCEALYVIRATCDNTSVSVTYDSSLTLSTHDRECVLRFETGSPTGETLNEVYAFSAKAKSSILSTFRTIATDEEAASGGGGSFVNPCCSGIVKTAAVIPSPPVMGDSVLVGGWSNPLAGWEYEKRVIPTSGCPLTITEIYKKTVQPSISAVNISVGMAQPPGKQLLAIFGSAAGGEIEYIDQARLWSRPMTDDDVISMPVVQGAFYGRNLIAPAEGGSISGNVVARIGEKEYGVRHHLYGWIGVA